MVIRVGGFATDNFHRLIRFGNGDDVENRATIGAMYGFSNEPRVRQVKERRKSGVTKTTTPNVQGVSPAQPARRSGTARIAQSPAPSIQPGGLIVLTGPVRMALRICLKNLSR